MNITEKMLKAYFGVAEHIKSDQQMTATAKAFHRTKKVAFFVEARRLNEDGLLPDEIPYQNKHTVTVSKW